MLSQWKCVGTYLRQVSRVQTACSEVFAVDLSKMHSLLSHGSLWAVACVRSACILKQESLQLQPAWRCVTPCGDSDCSFKGQYCSAGFC